MYCRNCGNEIKEGVNFCGKCGVEVCHGGIGKNKKSFSKKIRKTTEFLTVSFIFILITGLLLTFFYKKNDSEKIDLEACKSMSEVESVNGVHKRYVQMFNGIPIYNSVVVENIDNSGQTNMFGIYYDVSQLENISVADINTSPEWLTVIEDEGCLIAPIQESIQAVIYVTDEKEAVPALNFYVCVSGESEDVYLEVVTSLDGETIYFYQNLNSNFQTAEVFSDKETMEVMYDDNEYYAVSDNHYYFVWNKKSTEYSEIESDLTDCGFELTKEKVYKTNTDIWSDGYNNHVFKSMSAMNDVEDFFAEEFGYYGIDGEKNYAKLVVLDESLDGTAFCGGTHTIVMGTTYDGKKTVSESPEILAHEFTHGVLKNYCGLYSVDESGALHEAIADVFAVIYSNSTDWKLAENLSDYLSVKDIASTERTMEDFKYNADDTAYDWLASMVRYIDLGKKFKFFRESSEHAHYNSYILSHTLYEISKNVFGNDLEEFGKIMFKSLQFLLPNSGFSEFRSAFETAVALLYDDSIVKKCEKYFEKSGIESKYVYISVVKAKDYKKGNDFKIEESDGTDSDKNIPLEENELTYIRTVLSAIGSEKRFKSNFYLSDADIAFSIFNMMDIPYNCVDTKDYIPYEKIGSDYKISIEDFDEACNSIFGRTIEKEKMAFIEQYAGYKILDDGYHRSANNGRGGYSGVELKSVNCSDDNIIVEYFWNEYGTAESSLNRVPTSTIELKAVFEKNAFFKEPVDADKYPLRIWSIGGPINENTGIKFDYKNKVAALYDEGDLHKEYIIYDMDQDGTTELIYFKGTCMADLKIHYYTYENGKVLKLDERTESTLYETETGVGLYGHWAHMDNEILHRINKVGNEIVYEVVFERDDIKSVEQHSPPDAKYKLQTYQVNDYTGIELFAAVN